jgi:CHAT domain-containing protein
MRFCHKKRKGRRQKALVVGDSLNDLRFARQEAISVATIFNTNAYLNSKATKLLIKEKLKNDNIDILHLACHGVFDPITPLKSHIVLAPEINGKEIYIDKANEQKWNLTAEEIFGMKMHLDLVTLSSCESGVNTRKPGDELIGLTRSLIYAGTPSVIVSLWEVNDLSTSLIMQHFYQELQKKTQNGESPITKAEAMQSAQNHVRNMNIKDVIDISRNMKLQVNNNPRHMKPIYQDALTEYKSSTDSAKPFEKMYYWAPFILVGDWK